MALMESSPAGALRSFVAAAICLPAFLGLRLFSWSALGGEDGLLRPLAAELTGYVYGWVLFALVCLPVIAGWGRAALWPRFLVAWNWISVVQYLAQILLALLLLAGLPTLLGQGLTLAVVGYSLWLEWFMARAALGISGGRAVGLVALDVALGLFIASFVQRLSLG
ncbi:hypothetical protein [Falsiroseomonas tokyonensis]|uniref:Uncharacterized protein n=1 Tax=Falsiroseomonas tokyonensis TaxID=430521 RepID=A0ABV7BSM7_9PROT|nr:hypothetical protein [Falsiroseomonas tokyonensis]MBU8537446.1 hypothetical protein [Falsiroseomonas tokyonensis]